MTLDVAALFSRAGADIVMFLTAMLAYFILQRVKTRVAPRKTICKESDDQESPSECTNDILDSQTPPQARAVMAKIIVQHQPMQHQPKKGKIAEAQPNKGLCKLPMPAKGPFDLTENLTMMRNYAASRNIKDTLQAFRLIQQNGVAATSAMYNSVMLAWVNCGNIWAAENCMEEAKAAGLIDGKSFVILINALVPIGDLDKVRTLLQEMKEKVPSPSVTIFDELLLCLAWGGLFSDGISLLKHMHESGVTPAQSTLCAIAKLVNGARSIHLRCGEIWEVLSKYDFESKSIDEVSQQYPSELPRFLFALAHPTQKFFHDVEIKGSMVGINALRVTLAQPKISAILGHFAIVGGQPDKQQDNVKRAQVAGVLRCVSKDGLRLPWNLEEMTLQYLGSNVHVFRLNFESDTALVVDEISCLHPRLGFRHCWAKSSSGLCGQRTLSNGEDIDEASFNRHINAVHTNVMN